MPANNTQRVLVTGANGYIGSRLIQALANQGVPVRALVRQTDWLKRYQAQYPNIEIALGDVREQEKLEMAMRGVETAYYLIHSIGAAGDFVAQERECAYQFAKTATRSGVSRIIYLGGLADENDGNLSEHLDSRIRVGDILRKHHPVVIEFRASIVLGTGSISFEIIRSLVDRLPVMVTPKWVTQKTQPIFVDDVIRYLCLARQARCNKSVVAEIGGPDQVTYKDVMLAYAAQTKRCCFIVTLPVLTPRLSSLWLGFITPVYARIGRKLIDGLLSPSIVRQPESVFILNPPPISYREAIRRIVLGKEESTGAWWFQARSSIGAIRKPPTLNARSFRIVVSREVDAPVSNIVAVIREIGIKQDYFFANWLWRLRGWIDLLSGGAGHLRTKNYIRNALEVGDVVGWWRVTELLASNRIKLESEMNLPGNAELLIAWASVGEKSSVVSIVASYTTDSKWGKFYWWALYPVHLVMFNGMLLGIRRNASLPAFRRGDA